MFRRFSTNFALFSMCLDFALAAAGFWSAIHLRPYLNNLPFAADVRIPQQIPWYLYLLFSIIWVSSLLLFSLYDGRRNLRVVDEFSTLTLASIVAGISIAGMLFLTVREISRILFLLFVLITFLAQLSWRLAYRVALRSKWAKPSSVRQVLIVGAGLLGSELEQEIQNKSWMGLSVTGFLDDDSAKLEDNPKVLGGLEDARQVILDYPVSDVVIALPLRAYQKVNALVASVLDLPVRVHIIPDYFYLALHKAVSEEFAGIPMLDLRAPALNEYQRMVKRAFDLVVCSFAVLPLLPLMGLIALAIKLDSPGPVIFKQKRVGENGNTFTMYKFRSMVVDADQRLNEVMRTDESGHLVHKNPDDPRVTKFGSFIRRKSLDELPQIFNILKGDMSLVGPRPELPRLVEMYQPWQRIRFAVPQGLTGWWQVNGRSDKPMHLNTEDDIYYVQHYSLMLDIYILIKTVWVALRGKGAF